MKHFMEIGSPTEKEWGLNHQKKSMNGEWMAWERFRKLWLDGDSEKWDVGKRLMFEEILISFLIRFSDLT